MEPVECFDCYTCSSTRLNMISRNRVNNVFNLRLTISEATLIRQTNCVYSIAAQKASNLGFKQISLDLRLSLISVTEMKLITVRSGIISGRCSFA